MRLRVVFRPAARDELAEAAAWYRSKSVVVTQAFREATRQTIDRIVDHPTSFVEILPGNRRALTPQFPYAIFFAVENDVLIILAVKHQAQTPQHGRHAPNLALHRAPTGSWRAKERTCDPIGR